VSNHLIKNMKKINVILLVLLLMAGNVFPQKSRADDPKMDWWKEAKFGMFIHWGLYCIPGGEWNGKKTTNIAEWIMNDLKIPVSDYKAYANQFNPTGFNADDFVLLAKEAGMKYMVLTAKHHEGFAMFKSSDLFNVVDATPYKKDVVKQLADACKKYNMPFGLYYSQAQDWTHAGGGKYCKNWDIAQDGSFDKYLNEVAIPQITEILTNYNPRIIWWDTPAEMTRERAAKIEAVLHKYPNLITNDRLGGDVEGDLETPEQYIPATGVPGKNWESCMTMNNTWGYSKFDTNWKSAESLIRNLIDIASKGGNYLLNVGPTPEGLIPGPSIERLKEVGKWMKVNGEAIYGTKASPFSELKWGRATQKASGNNTILYLNVFDWPVDGNLTITGLENKILKAYPLIDPSKKLKITEKEAEKTIDVRNVKKMEVATVIVIEIKGKPVVNNTPVITSDNSIYTSKIEFSITSDTKNGIIHYTTDGTEPTLSGKIAKDNILMNATGKLVIKASTFLNGKPVSAVSTATFEQEQLLDPAYEGKPGLKYKYFEGSWEKLPDFTKLSALKTGITPDINLNEKKQASNYGFTFNGYINVPENDVYAFFLSSDDGSKLIIDDLKVLDFDGMHGMSDKRMDVALSAGLHRISIQFFQHDGDDGLKLEWKQTGKERKLVDKSVLSH
jgi:alpha-L-fucosidase